MAVDVNIAPEIQILLQYAGEDLLTETIWTLSDEQRKSHIFKQLGEQRFLSSLRAGNIDNAQLTKIAFMMEPKFFESKVATDAAIVGFNSEVARGRIKVAMKIKKEMNLDVELPAVTQEDNSDSK